MPRAMPRQVWANKLPSRTGHFLEHPTTQTQTLQPELPSTSLIRLALPNWGVDSPILGGALEPG